MARTGSFRKTLIYTVVCGLAASCASDDGGDDAPGTGGSVTAPGNVTSSPAAAQSNDNAGPASGGAGLETDGMGPAAAVPLGDMTPADEMTDGMPSDMSTDMPGDMPTEGMMTTGGDTPAVEDAPGAAEPAASDSTGVEQPEADDSTGSAPEEPDPEGSDVGEAPETDGSEGEAFDGKELFILIGQSNMSGMSPMPSDPWPINERVTFMVQFDCERLGQTAGEWLPAEPPLHGCQWATGGIGLGLADFFGAKLAEQWPDSKIGLIPNAVPGQLISIYLKEGGTSAPVSPYANAYEMTVERSLKAQEQGRIRAILLHQGESDDNQGMSEQWLDRVATVIADLRADLNLGEEVPLLAGEIGPSQWEKHNAYVDQIPDYVPNSAVISSEGTAIHDIAHFDEASAKIMGERYVEKFLELVPEP